MWITTASVRLDNKEKFARNKEYDNSRKVTNVLIIIVCMDFTKNAVKGKAENDNTQLKTCQHLQTTTKVNSLEMNFV